MRTIWTIASLGLRRLARDRASLFFTILFPIMIIAVIGRTFFSTSASSVELGVLAPDAGPLAQELIRALDSDSLLKVAHFDELDEMRLAVRRETIPAAVRIPEGYDAAVQEGRQVEIEFLFAPQSFPSAVRATITDVITQHASRYKAAALVSETTGVSFTAALDAAERLQNEENDPGVITETVGEAEQGLGGFSYPAASNLILFMFITSLAASGHIIEDRKLGRTHRMLATPTRASWILSGTALGRFIIAATQGLIVLVVSSLVFGVGWGDPAATAALVVAFAFVSTGAAMLVGTMFSTAEQAGAVGPPLGIALGMLGGCMWPLEVVGETMRTVGHATPHAWAMDAFVGVLTRGESLGGITSELYVLLGFALVLLTVSSLRLNRALTR